MARKVVGVGSVGTRAFIVLLQGRDQQDPLFLQVKEATASVLRGSPAQEPLSPTGRASRAGPADDAGRERHLPRVDEGRRGQPLPVLAPTARHEGLRRRRDAWRPQTLAFYARVCGQTLARAHARSGDPVAIAAYLGKKDRFDQSITDFSERYADQNERDYEAFTDAIRSGRLEAVEGV